MVLLRSRRVPRILSALLSAIVVATPARAGEPVVTTDLLRMRTVSAIAVARDGARAVIAVQSIATPPAPAEGASVRPPRPVNQAHLYLLDLGRPESAPRQLTVGDRRDGAPAISPDGASVAFVRADGAGRPQVWVMPLDGGEARQVTDLPRGARDPQWAPAGRTLLVTSAVPLEELPGAPPFPTGRPGRQWNDDRAGAATPRPDGDREEIRAWLAENARAGDAVVIERLEFQDESTLRTGIELDQLFVVDLDREGAPPARITSAFRDHREARFLPDGRIVYAAKADETTPPDRVLRWTLRTIGADGAGDGTLLAPAEWSVQSPQPSGDGATVAFIAERADDPGFAGRRIGSVALAGGGGVTWLTGEGFDLSVRALEWMPSRSRVIFTVAARGAFPLMTVGRGLVEPAPIVAEEAAQSAGVHAFGAGGGAIVYAATTVASPCVVRVSDAHGDRLAWDLNEWTAAKEISLPRRMQVTRPDGLAIEGWIMEPTRREPGRRYPLVVEIHGGPAGMWGPGELTMWHEFQLLCSWGYGVLYCNPRGSDGYGLAFRRANFQDWSAGPAGDVLAAVDRAMLEEWVDVDRLVLTGGSYGGYLTAWIVANDARFKAAVAQRGVYDIETFAGEGNAWRLVEWSMGGFPWDPRVRAVIDRESPFTFVNRIRTPLLILHGSSDLRTGVAQSEMMYRALRQLGRPVEYVRHPGADHELSRSGDPIQRMDRLARIIEFFERFVASSRPAPGTETSP
jgi:dipeptidyl aminopeptidase/acylaminoacyl peptidase